MEIIKINDNLYVVKNVQDKKTHEIYEEAWAKTGEELEEKFEDAVSENADPTEENPETI